ncbi:MAG: UPF0147 family protein [Nanoarchaeota archaeon]|nr:UPF0147 family protein [Nanoarchaeota archaeon]
MPESIEEIKACINELNGDSSTPKNVCNKVGEVLSLLESDGDMSINVSKALNILEELSDDINIESFTRTQLWNLVSLLEKVA